MELQNLIIHWAESYAQDESNDNFDKITTEIKDYASKNNGNWEDIIKEVNQNKIKIITTKEDESIPLIPKTLQKPEFRFILLGHWENFRNKKNEIKRIPGRKTKKNLEELKTNGWVACGKIPEERNWQETNNYAYNNPKLISHMNKGLNYGIATGHGDLAILDDDTPGLELIKRFTERIGKTFKVLTGSQGIHLYIKIPRMDKKIIFYNKDGTHCGELQWKTQQCVAVGSIHPLGIKYEVLEDNPILEVDIETFKEVFKDYIPKKEKIIREEVKIEFNGERIQDIPITNIVSTVGMIDMGHGCFQGAHPKHGSTGGMNFRINTHNNTWFCYRCTGGGGPSELIGVMEGIISCNSAGSACYTPEQGKQVIEIAREKYGLKVPEDMKTQLTSQFIEWMENHERGILDNVFNLDSFTLSYFKDKFKLDDNLSKEVIDLLVNKNIVEFDTEKDCFFIPKSATMMKQRLIAESIQDLKMVFRNDEKKKKQEEREAKKNTDEIEKIDKEIKQQEEQELKKADRIKKKEGDLKNSMVTITATGPIRSWDDVMNIDKFVIYPGEEYIYEIHMYGKVIRIEGPAISDYKVFIVKVFEQFHIHLKAFKGIREFWSDLLTHWASPDYLETITPNKEEFSTPASAAQEEIISYLDTCAIADNYIVKEGIVTYKNETIYVPSRILDRLLKRQDIKLTSRKLAYALREYLLADSIPLKVENKSVRFWRFNPKKLNLDWSKRISIQKEADIEVVEEKPVNVTGVPPIINLKDINLKDNENDETDII